MKEIFERRSYIICACMVFIVAMVGLPSAKAPEPTFVIEPASVNASLSNEVVEFTCVCIYCTSQFWVVDDLWALNEVYKGRGIQVDDRKTLTNGSFFYRLTLPPTKVNNNTNISCVIHNTTSNIVKTSQFAALRVQGLLGEVEELKVTSITNTTLLVSFEEPTSLLGVPILYYSIVVITVYTMDIISTTNSTKTTVYLDLDRVHICSQLEVMVSGWNEVGEGHIAKISALLSDAPTALNADFITTDVQYQGSILEVSLQFEINESCVGRTPDSVMLNISSIEGLQLVTTELCPLPKSLADGHSCQFPLSLIETAPLFSPLVRIGLSQFLQANNHYLISVILSNQAGISSSTHFVTISTYDVQEGYVHISVLESVCISCTILIGSPMKTCIAIFTEINSETRFEVVIPAPTFTDCVELPTGQYSVEFRDVNISGDVEMGVAYHVQTIVQVNLTSPPLTEPTNISVTTITTQSSQSSTNVPIFPIAVVGSGVVIGLLVIVLIIMLVIYLHHFRTKAGKLMKEKQEGDKAHHSDSTHHPNTVVGEFGNTASEPKHLYDNIDELNAHRRPVIIFAHSSIAIPPSSICMQQCPAYAELPKIPQNLTTVPAMQTNQDTNTDVGRHN